MSFLSSPVIPPLLAGLLMLGCALRLSHARTRLVESILLGMLGGMAASLSAAALLTPFWLALGLIAVWPIRALVVLASGVATMIALHYNGITLPLPNLPFSTGMAAGLVLLIVTIYQLYHWRWWPALRHLQVGSTTTALLLASAAIGNASPVVWVSFLLVPLPIWAWWLAKQRQPF